MCRTFLGRRRRRFRRGARFLPPPPQRPQRRPQPRDPRVRTRGSRLPAPPGIRGSSLPAHPRARVRIRGDSARVRARARVRGRGGSARVRVRGRGGSARVRPWARVGVVAAACRLTPGFGGALGSLSGTGLPGAGGCGEASSAPGGSSAGGATNPLLFAAGRNHRPDSPAGAAASAMAGVPSLAAPPAGDVVPPAGDVLSARGAGPGPSEVPGADRKATSASVNSVPALPSRAISSSPAALPSLTVPLPPAAPPSPVTPSLPSLPRSSPTDLPLPSSVAGRRDGTRLKYRPGRALRTNTRVARKWSAILIVPVQRVMTAPRARPYLHSMPGTARNPRPGPT